MIMTIDIKKLRDAALRAKSAAEQYANGEINPTELSRQCSEFNSLTDSPEQILALLDEIEGATAHVALLKIDRRELVREAEEKDARIAELNHRLSAAENNEIDARCHLAELQSRAEAAEKCLSNLAAVSRRYLPDYDEHPEIQAADDLLEQNSLVAAGGIHIQGGEK